MMNTLAPAILDTVLARLALLFLAANIISFSFHALEALGQAAIPDMPLNKILRLRGSAVSLSRESNKAERRLDQLRKSRTDAMPADPAPAPQPSPGIEKALDLIADTRQVAAVAEQTGQTWTQAYRQRQRDRNLAKLAARTQSRPASHPPA